MVQKQQRTGWELVWGTGVALGIGIDMDAMQAGASVTAKTRARSRLEDSAHGYDRKKTNLVAFLPIHD